MTFYEEHKGVTIEAQRRMVDSLFARAMQELKLSREQLVLRPLRPQDLGGSDISATVSEWRYGFNGGNTAWSTITPAGATIADNRFTGINGVFHAEGVADAQAVRITREGKVARIWQTSVIRQFKHQTGWCDDPVTFEQNTPLTIEGWSRTASTTVDFGFIGATVERRGLLINP